MSFCKELIKRLPNNAKVFDGMSKFTPKVVLNLVSRPTFKDLPLFLVRQHTDIGILETQWNTLVLVNRTELYPRQMDENIQSSAFWALIYNHKNAGGEQLFQDIAELALRAFSLPFSNAEVERVFSVMGIIKTKSRNKIHINMLDSLLRIRLHLTVKKICCNKFKSNELMLSLFNSKIYVSNASESTSTDIEAEELDSYGARC